MLKKKSGGFTLIEVSMVLAITAAMVAIIFSGQHSIRSSAEFSDTVHMVVSDLDAVRNAAQTSDDSDLTYAQGNGSTNQTPSGLSDPLGTSNIIWGKLIEATYAGNGTNTYITVTDLIATYSGNQQTTDCNTLSTAETITRGASYTINMPYGITVSNSNNKNTVIVLHRQLCGGQLQTYNFSQDNIGGINTPALDPTVEANYYAVSAFNENPPYGCIHDTTGGYTLVNPNPLSGHCYVNPQVAHITLTNPDGRTADIVINGNQGSSIIGQIN